MPCLWAKLGSALLTCKTCSGVFCIALQENGDLWPLEFNAARALLSHNWSKRFRPQALHGRGIKQTTFRGRFHQGYVGWKCSRGWSDGQLRASAYAFSRLLFISFVLACCARKIGTNALEFYVVMLFRRGLKRNHSSTAAPSITISAFARHKSEQCLPR